MTRTTLRRTLSALAALALISVFTGAPASAQGNADSFVQWHFKSPGASKPKTSKGLATSQQTPTTHYEFRWWQDYSGGK